MSCKAGSWALWHLLWTTDASWLRHCSWSDCREHPPPLSSKGSCLAGNTPSPLQQGIMPCREHPPPLSSKGSCLAGNTPSPLQQGIMPCFVQDYLLTVLLQTKLRPFTEPRRLARPVPDFKPGLTGAIRGHEGSHAPLDITPVYRTSASPRMEARHTTLCAISKREK